MSYINAKKTSNGCYRVYGVTLPNGKRAVGKATTTDTILTKESIMLITLFDKKTLEVFAVDINFDNSYIN